MATISGAINSEMNVAAAQTHMDKFQAPRGHGFAAEQANHLYDVLTGKDAALVGGNNAKNGADRLVDGIQIQTKYCGSAQKSVAEAFDNGRYRYLNPNGSPMQLEVPADQYDKAVELMANRIKNGQVPNVTNPADAKDIVRRGHYTLAQAKNIAKFGTVESLKFDAANGVVISTSAFGITAVITFAQSILRGESTDIAVENAVYSGIQIGGASFVNTIITSQLMRTGLMKAMAAPTKAAVKMLNPKTSAALTNSLRTGANVCGNTAVNNLANLLRGNIISTAVMTAMLSAKDISNAFRRRISGKQLFKNVVKTVGSMAGGTGGLVIGQMALNLIPGAGAAAGIVVSLAGAAVGGTLGHKATDTLVGKFVEDDAVQLVRIIEGKFTGLVQEYLLTREEVDIILDDIKTSLEGEKLLEMFASKDHEAFAEELLRPLIERLVSGRCRIYLPNEAAFIQGLERVVADIEQNGRLSVRTTVQKEVDPVEIGRVLTGKELPAQAARKGLYAAKQMNMAQVQAENRLQKIAASEGHFTEEINAIRQERTQLKNELDALLGGKNNGK